VDQRIDGADGDPRTAAGQLEMRATTVVLALLLVGGPRTEVPRDQAGADHIHGVGHVHMDTSCSSTTSADFDRALALLHNFWYNRALDAFKAVTAVDPACAMAYWGAAMTFNHPFWDAPTPSDELTASTLVQKGLKATHATAREKMFLAAVAALYKDAGARAKPDRDEAYRQAMKALYEKYPDDETGLFYGLSILGTIKEGTRGFDQQAVAAKIFERVYAKNPDHPGALHYLIHVYDDPEHALDGLPAARAYAKAAAAVPHAQHMPSHIFTRLGYWQESAATNENAWRSSEESVKRSGESGGYRDFHSLNYLQYAYLQLGRYRDARRMTDIIKQQFDELPNKKTAPETPDLQARHVRGRTIYALPDRVAYGYFDMLTRYIVESGGWQAVSAVPLVAPSRDFVAMKLQLEAMAAAKRGDPGAATAAAARIAALAEERGQHPFAQQVIAMQARETEAIAAHASGHDADAVAKMEKAIAIEDSIYALSQPPYPIVPAHELYATLLMEMKRPSDAAKHFAETLERTPGRPKAVFGAAQAADALGDVATARARYEEFLRLWKDADPDRPELGVARQRAGTEQREMFAESDAYERFMGRWSRRLAPLLVKVAAVGERDDVLDVGSGTGALAFAITDAMPSARITGVDPSDAYVKYATSRAPSERVRFMVGDAQNLQLPDGSFDRTLALLVMNFIPDSTKALREMVRVTRPGGVVAAAVWDYGEGMEMLRVFWDEAFALDAGIAARDERNMPLCKRGELAALWRATGLQQVDEQPITIDLAFPSFDDYWSPFLGGQGPAGSYVASLPEPARVALASRLRKRLLGERQDGPIALRARAWAVKGVVPAR
jgi:SAM-dependent methyltransferase